MNAADINSYIRRLERDLAQRDKSIINLLEQLEAQARPVEPDLRVDRLLDLLEKDVSNAEKLKGNGPNLTAIIEVYRELRPR